MKKTPLTPQQNINIFDKDLLVQKLFKDTNSYQGFIVKLEAKLKDFDLQEASNMIQPFIGEIYTTMDKEKSERLATLIQENNITEMDDNFLKLSEEQRILITQYRHENNKGENYSRDKNYGCGGGYGFFKNPTDCGSCVSGEKNLSKAGLGKLAEFKGDRCFKIPDEIIEKADLSLFTDDEIKEINELKSDLNGYVEKIKILEQQEKTRNAMIEFFAKYNQAGDYKTISKSMPTFTNYVQEKKLFQNNINALNIFQEDGLVIYVGQGSQINGTGPMTYRITTTIWYDGQEKSFRHIVRDPSNPDYYDTSFYKPTLKLLSKQEKGEDIEFQMRVINDDNSNYLNYTTQFKKSLPETIAKLNEKEQEEFKQFFEKTMQDQCKSETRENGIMFSRINNTKVERPRDKAEITDKYLDIKNGIGAFILKTQIDTGVNASDRNKQYGRRGYVVHSDGKVDNVRYKCGREAELGLMDFSISDPRKIDKEKVTAIFETTAQSLLGK